MMIIVVSEVYSKMTLANRKFTYLKMDEFEMCEIRLAG